MKALFGLWGEMKVSDINRILKPHGVKLVAKGSKAWGKQVTVTAHATGLVVKRVRTPKPPAGAYPDGGQTTALATGDGARMEAGFNAALDLTRTAVNG